MAIATPPGRGGLGVVRLSGPASAEVASMLLARRTALSPRYATLCRVIDLDAAIATFFPGPRSYTGDDVVEISTHGSPVVLKAVVEAAISAGARLAEPGEFTLRAFLNGKLDLVQAEAVADLIDAVTPLQARAAFDQLDGTLTRRIAELEGTLFDVVARLEASLDFPDEGYHFISPTELATSLRRLGARLDVLLADAARGRLIREGATVAIVGRPNVGKSSVFNALVGTGRAIVADQPGTTRDIVTERIDLGGWAVTLADSAGLRTAVDDVEREGAARARAMVEVAAAVIVVVDGAEPLRDEDRVVLEFTRGHRRVVVANKSDLPAAWSATALHDDDLVRVSALSGEGMESLRGRVVEVLGRGGAPREGVAMSNLRHAQLLSVAAASVAAAETSATQGAPEECVVMDLLQARRALEEVTGTRSSEDVLRHIFERFCIGK